MKTIEIETTQSKVHAVTVFQTDRAEVVRLCTVDLEAGQNEVEISQLPNVLDQDSIRVDGIGGKAVISDVVYHPPTSDDSEKKQAYTLAVKDLHKSKAALQKQLQVCTKQASLLQNYAESLKGADTTGTTLNEFLDVYAERLASIDLKSTELSEQIQEVDKSIAKEMEVWNADAQSRKRAVSITVIVYAEHAGPAEISLTYLVSNASWTPLYDLRAATGSQKASISLQYRATISQYTGEDWNDVKMTLSTASPQLGSNIPKLTPHWIAPIIVPNRQNVRMARGGIEKKEKSTGATRRSYSPRSRSYSPRSRSYSPRRRSYLPNGGDGDESSDDLLFRLAGTTAVAGTISTSYIIDGLSTIPSDTESTSQAHKVTVAVIDLSVDLDWIAVPKEQPSAFLRAKIKNTSPYLFLPGRANIFLENNFVAKSRIEHVSPNETFSCSLGVDPQVKVTYHPRTKKSRSQSGMLSRGTTTIASHQKITIKNNRSTAIPRLLVREQIPVPRDERLKVTLIDPASIEFLGRSTVSAGTSKGNKTLQIPKAKRLDEGIIVQWKVNDDEDAEADTKSTAGVDGAREGILEWICEIGPGKSTDLNLAWEVTAPSNLNWGPK